MMTEKAIATPSRTMAIIKKHGLTLKKSLGQNFLVDSNVLQHILHAAHVDDSTAVLEIGPGIGALTEVLAEAAGRVIAVELDQRLLPILQELMAQYEHVTIIHGDILKQEVQEAVSHHLSTYSQFSVVANLPYYVTTPIIMSLLEAKLPIDRMVVMIQKEVAERMSAQPGNKDYGSLSIAVQYYAIPERVAVVPPKVFVPQPKVDSAIMRLTMRQHPPVDVLNEAFFFRVVRASFAQRRKTIFNNLSAEWFKQKDREDLRRILDQCHIDAMRRGETLSLQEFASLSNALYEYLHDE